MLGNEFHWLFAITFPPCSISMLEYGDGKRIGFCIVYFLFVFEIRWLHSTGILLGKFEVGDIMECKKRCIMSANCLSLNILPNPNGGFVCQLNSGLKEDGVRGQFVPHGAGEYYGLKVSIQMKYLFLLYDDAFVFYERRANQSTYTGQFEPLTDIDKIKVNQISVKS